MIPIRDNVPRVHPPISVVAIIVLNALAFIYELGLPLHGKVELFHLLGVVPYRFFNPDWATMMGFPESSVLPFFSYMFLHSGWFHVIMNMWMLWIFGDNIEDVMGHGWFVVFYLVCGVAAVGAHMLAGPASRIPVIGASGAVAGIMGAYMVLYPHGKVYTLIILIFFPFFIRIPAVLFLGIWGASQFLSGVSSVVGQAAQPVAWWAHIGGFITGALLIFVFRRKDRCYYCFNPESRDYDKPVDRDK